MIKDFRNKKTNKKNGQFSSFWDMLQLPHTVISNSEKLTHPSIRLTPTAYGDLAEALVKKEASTAEDGSQPKPRRRAESVVTRSAGPTSAKPTPGWILGNNMSNQRGHGGPFRRRRPWPPGGGVRRGLQTRWRGTSGSHWNPY